MRASCWILRRLRMTDRRKFLGTYHRTARHSFGSQHDTRSKPADRGESAPPGTKVVFPIGFVIRARETFGRCRKSSAGSIADPTRYALAHVRPSEVPQFSAERPRQSRVPCHS